MSGYSQILRIHIEVGSPYKDLIQDADYYPLELAFQY